MKRISLILMIFINLLQADIWICADPLTAKLKLSFHIDRDTLIMMTEDRKSHDLLFSETKVVQGEEATIYTSNNYSLIVFFKMSPPPELKGFIPVNLVYKNNLYPSYLCRRK